MFDDFDVKEIPASEGKEFVRRYHYSRGSHNGPSGCYGLFRGKELIGVLLFATPNSENVRASVFGPEYVGHVAELHRLVVLDGTPTNTESWFIARALKLYKKKRPHVWAVVSFADSTEGHQGTIYQATNFHYYGKSSSARFYLDGDGRLRHPRQNGRNITMEEARERGWTAVRRQPKHRYCLFLPDDRRHKRTLLLLCRLDFQPYPTNEEKN